MSETGALCPPLENVTQGLDILMEAVKTLGLTIGEDIYLAINCAGHETFDYVRCFSIDEIYLLYFQNILSIGTFFFFIS